MAKQKPQPYAIYYNDNSYMIYDLTKDDYDALSSCVTNNVPAVKLSIGTLALADVRSVIKQKEEIKPAKPTKTHEHADPIIDAETYAWLHEQRELEKEGRDQYGNDAG